jgi:DNA-binding transcriptional regulator YhcF (GntR family)
MKFDDEVPIYIQIENFIRDKIFNKIWIENERIPSVREMAGILEVNPNTVMRAYEELQEAQLIYIQRGVGYFVAANAYHTIFSQNRNQFYEHLPTFFNSMKELDISIDTLINEYHNYTSNIKNPGS